MLDRFALIMTNSMNSKDKSLFNWIHGSSSDSPKFVIILNYGNVDEVLPAITISIVALILGSKFYPDVKRWDLDPEKIRE